MKSLNPIPIGGNPASPYTRKMLSLLRYRRVPYSVQWGDPREFLKKFDVEEPKPVLLPVMIFDVNGENKAICDSTPIIRHLEDDFTERSVIPRDPPLAFLNYLLEDFGDEWVTKYMFHYRWHFKDDINNAGTRLPLLYDVSLDEERHGAFKKHISDLQIGRLWVVGSNEKTAPVIEASFKRFLEHMEQFLTLNPFLLGKRPSSADFAIYGQLTQLVGFDPTPRAIACQNSPRVMSWLELLEDLSGLEVKDSDWLSFEAAQTCLSSIFKEIGKGYVPALVANYQNVMNDFQDWETEIDGARWKQRSFPYQAKCLRWINEEFNQLCERDQENVRSFLSKTGCAALILDN